MTQTDCHESSVHIKPYVSHWSLFKADSLVYSSVLPSLCLWTKKPPLIWRLSTFHQMSWGDWRLLSLLAYNQRLLKYRMRNKTDAWLTTRWIPHHFLIKLVKTHFPFRSYFMFTGQMSLFGLEGIVHCFVCGKWGSSKASIKLKKTATICSKWKIGTNTHTVKVCSSCDCFVLLSQHSDFVKIKCVND